MNLLQRIKVLFTGIGAMLLLVIIAISPVLLSKWNDSRILAQVIVEKINEKDILSMHTSKLSTEEKIKLLYDYNSEIQNYVCIKQLIKSKEDYNKIRENIVQEIKELQNLQIIPIVDLNETYENNTFNTVTYAKATDPESCVVLIQATFISEEGYLEIWIDGNDNKIYKYHFINYVFKKEDMKSGVALSKKGIVAYGVDYLGLSKEEVFEHCTIERDIDHTYAGIIYL